MNDKESFIDSFNYNMFDDILKEIKRNQKKSKHDHAYYDGYISINSFSENASIHYAKIKKSLESKTYKFSKLYPVLLPKEGKSGYRMICIPSIQDKIVQKALIRYMQKNKYLIYSESTDFSLPVPIENSNQKKQPTGAAGARRLALNLRKKYSYALKTDISSFFDNVNRHKLMQKITEELEDIEIYYLLQSAIGCDPKTLNFSTAEKNAFVKAKIGKGVRQGMPISPMLASFYLSDFDNFMKDNKIKMIRYADDLLFFAKTEKEAHNIFDITKKRLRKEGLDIPPLEEKGKSQIYNQEETIRFLGLDLTFDKNLNNFKWRIPEETIKAIEKDLCDFSDIEANLKKGLDLSSTLKKIEQIIEGYIVCFNEDLDKEIFDSFESTLLSIKENTLTNILQKLEINLSKLSTSQRKFLFGLTKAEKIQLLNKKRNPKKLESLPPDLPPYPL